ncbi:MAG: hypothetical protein MZU79_05750 [Anaerotruncus sp.]|nr:hypothetical protein [Anaerotruncus sp.]
MIKSVLVAAAMCFKSSPACVYLGGLGFLLYWKSRVPGFRRYAIGG